MHVLIIPSWYPSTPDDVGGSFFREQAIGLHEAGCKVGVIYPQLRSLRRPLSAIKGPRELVSSDDSGVATLRWHGISWYPHCPVMQANQWIHAGRKLYLAYVKRFGRPDVLHAHSLLFGGCVARDLGALHGIPYFVTEHSSAYGRELLRPRQLRLAKRAAHGASRAYAVSDSMCNLLQVALGADVAPWEPLPNTVSQRFLQAPLPAPCGTRGTFKFLHVSLLGNNKAVDVLIRAFAAAFSPDDDAELWIGGDGPERERLQALAAQLGVGKAVRFKGALSRDSVVDVMSACDAFVLSSRTETFGVVLIEALALGRPVVATLAGGPDSIVRPQDGLLVPVDDIAAMASALRSLHDNKAKYDPAVIRAGCAGRYSAAVVNERLLAAYSSAAATAAFDMPIASR